MKGHEFKRAYDSKARFASYWHQIDEVFKLHPASLLEVGVGTGFVALYLRHHGLSVTTLDVDSARNPDVVGSIKELPFPDGSFDCITACEVLEHMPYEDSEKALRELYRVAKTLVIISLPVATPFLRFELPIPKITRFRKLLNLRFISPRQPLHHEHSWEIGMRGYSLDRIMRSIRSAGFQIKKEYRVLENPRHHFFVLQKV
ncbi:MAG: methyltransferase domain-containing protein [Patescibacteria group bacterium]